MAEGDGDIGRRQAVELAVGIDGAVVAKRVAKVTVIPEGDRSAAVDVLIRTIAPGQERDLEYAIAVTANRLLDFEREYPRGRCLSHERASALRRPGRTSATRR